MKKRKIDWNQVIVRFVFISLLASMIFLLVRIIMAPTTLEGHPEDVRIKSDYALMFIQCCLGVVAMLLPGLFEKRLKLVISSNMMVLYAVFLYCAIYLGEVRNFYYVVPHWDTILHIFSGAMLGALGYSFVVLLNRSERLYFQMTPLFVAIFSFCFAVTLGVFWEIYEFTFDALLGLNMQKFALEDGTLLIGRAALADTMKDLIVDCLGAFVMVVIGYLSLKYKKGIFSKVTNMIHKVEHLDKEKENE